MKTRIVLLIVFCLGVFAGSAKADTLLELTFPTTDFSVLTMPGFQVNDTQLGFSIEWDVTTGTVFDLVTTTTGSEAGAPFTFAGASLTPGGPITEIDLINADNYGLQLYTSAGQEIAPAPGSYQAFASYQCYNQNTQTTCSEQSLPIVTVNVTPVGAVPEPGSVTMLMMGLACLGLVGAKLVRVVG